MGCQMKQSKYESLIEYYSSKHSPDGEDIYLHEDANPADLFIGFGQDITDWLLDLKASQQERCVFSDVWEPLDWLGMREERFSMALTLYLRVGNPKDLVHCRVSECFSPLDCGDGWGTFERWFIFKESNNGTTYRISDKSRYGFK